MSILKKWGLISGVLLLPLSSLQAKNFLTYFNAAQHNDNKLLNQYAQYHAAIDSVGIARSGLVPTIKANGTYQLSSNHHGYTDYDLSLNQSIFSIPTWAALYNAK